jgi:hypothetical protein
MTRDLTALTRETPETSAPGSPETSSAKAPAH